MIRSNPLGSYRPGSAPLHRLRPGAKLLGLLAFAVLVVGIGRGGILGAPPPSAVGAEWFGVAATSVSLGIGCALALLAGMRGRDLLRVVRGFAIVAVLLFAFQTWQHDWQRGFEVVGDLFALILAASAFTTSTAVDDMLDTIVWALRPLRPLGVDPARMALAFSLMITSVPTLLGLAGETREAARARGRGRDPRALLVPFALRTVAHAHLTGEALAARGIGDPEPDADAGTVR